MPQPSKTPTLSPNVAVNGSAIRTRRIELGENLKTFAPKVPVSITYLSQLELGRRQRVSPLTFRRLAAALGMADRADELKAAA